MTLKLEHILASKRGWTFKKKRNAFVNNVAVFVFEF